MFPISSGTDRGRSFAPDGARNMAPALWPPLLDEIFICICRCIFYPCLGYWHGGVQYLYGGRQRRGEGVGWRSRRRWTLSARSPQTPAGTSTRTASITYVLPYPSRHGSLAAADPVRDVLPHHDQICLLGLSVMPIAPAVRFHGQQVGRCSPRQGRGMARGRVDEKEEDESADDGHEEAERETQGQWWGWWS